jgi:osmoprotectant transport system substrate-binding protein
MNRKILAIGAGAAALALVLSACGKSSPSGDSTGGASGTIASKMLLGGPAEFKTRPDGVPGLQKIYGVTFQGFKVLDTGGPLTVTALKNGQVDAADLFTTDPAIKANNFVVLTDPKSNFAAQNVVPLVNKAKVNDTVTNTLNAISAKLTTEELTNLNAEASSDTKPSPETVAKNWLSKNNLT